MENTTNHNNKPRLRRIIHGGANVPPLENYYYYIRLTAFIEDNLGKPAPER